MYDVIYVCTVDDKVVLVWDELERCVEELCSIDVNLEDVIIEEFWQYCSPQRGKKYRICMEPFGPELIKPEMHFEKKMEKWESAVDGQAYSIDEYNLYAHQCVVESFDIPAMVADIRRHGYDVTEDMLKRFIELWVKREGKTYLSENGITIGSPCSCCNPFLVSILHNGDPSIKELYAV